MHDLDVGEKKLAEKYLRQSKASGELATSLLVTLQTLEAIPLSAEQSLRHIRRQVSSIFLVQLFLFYQEQLSAAIELAGAVISLQVLQLLIAQERRLTKTPSVIISS